MNNTFALCFARTLSAFSERIDECTSSSEFPNPNPNANPKTRIAFIAAKCDSSTEEIGEGATRDTRMRLYAVKQKRG
jgi:hypothetical protein